MIDELVSLEWEASRRSVIHDLDARVKIILVFLMIIIVAGYPQTTGIICISIPFGLIIGIMWLLSTLPVRIFLSRLL